MQLESYIYGEVCPDDVEVGEYIRFLVCLINQPWFKMTLHYCSDTKAVAFSVVYLLRILFYLAVI